MSISRQEAALELLKRRKARRQLTEFATYTTAGFAASRIHKEIGEVLDGVLRREPGLDRVLIQCPPQHGKSLLASENFPAKHIGEYPHMEIISASATAALAEEFGGKVRNKISSPEFNNLYPAVQLVEDSRAKGRWLTTQGGGYYAVGMGGQLFGRGGHLGMIDDPYASWEDGQSELVRRKVWDWYTGTFYNRIRPGGAIVVIQHRMAEDDLIGLLVNNERNGADRWKVISIPADLDDPPWPERYDRQALERIRDNTFPRKWSALYMQNPVPDDGTYFKRDNFRVYRELPLRLNYYVTGDFAVSDGQGDYTYIIVWGVDANENIYMVDSWHGQRTVDVWIEKLLDFCEQYEPARFVAEAGTIRRAVEPFLQKRMVQRDIYVSVEWLTTNANKPAMATTFQGLTEMQKVYVPSTAWAEQIVNQCVAFPAGSHDDAVDACSIFGRYIASTWAADEEVIAPEIAWNQPLTMGQMIHG